MFVSMLAALVMEGSVGGEGRFSGGFVFCVLVGGVLWFVRVC